jgi:phage shock protein C
MDPSQKLYRSNDDRIFFGVCGGIAHYLSIDSSLIRIIFILLTVLGGVGAIIYIVLVVIVPTKGGTRRMSLSEEIEEKIHGDTIRKKPVDLSSPEESTSPAEVKAGNERRVSERRNIVGLTFVLLGLYMFYGQLFGYVFPWRLFWPLALIFVGMMIIFGNRK